MFDKTEEYKSIEEALKTLKDECHKNGIPFMFIAPIKDDGINTEYKSDGITPGSLNIELNSDRIKKALNVLGGVDSLVRISAAEIGAEFDALTDDVMKVDAEDFEGNGYIEEKEEERKYY